MENFVQNTRDFLANFSLEFLWRVVSFDVDWRFSCCVYMVLLAALVSIAKLVFVRNEESWFDRAVRVAFVAVIVFVLGVGVANTFAGRSSDGQTALATASAPATHVIANHNQQAQPELAQICIPLKPGVVYKNTPSASGGQTPETKLTVNAQAKVEQKPPASPKDKPAAKSDNADKPKKGKSKPKVKKTDNMATAEPALEDALIRINTGKRPPEWGLGRF